MVTDITLDYMYFLPWRRSSSVHYHNYQGKSNGMVADLKLDCVNNLQFNIWFQHIRAQGTKQRSLIQRTQDNLNLNKMLTGSKGILESLLHCQLVTLKTQKIPTFSRMAVLNSVNNGWTRFGTPCETVSSFNTKKKLVLAFEHFIWICYFTDTRMDLILSLWKVYVLFLPSCFAFKSFCHCRPKNTWHASMPTSHNTLSAK